MLDTLRKFSSSIYAKFFLLLVIIPFVFWGMGPVFQSGKQNSIVEIGKKKISTQEFISYIQNYTTQEQRLDINAIEKILPNFIGENLLSSEIKNLEIRLSDKSLSKIIKNEKTFKKENKFSRTEYEKYLIKNSLNAASFENYIRKKEKREQLFEFIGGGIVPSNFLVNMIYNRINQKRNIQLIDLNNVFKKELNFTDKQIKTYFDKNKDRYKNIYKSIKFLKLNQKNLTGSDDYNDLFFKKIDEIDDLIVEGKNLDYILKKFNLGSANVTIFDASGENKNSEKTNDFSDDLIKNIFELNEKDSTHLVEQKNEYFIYEIIKIENIQRELSDKLVKKEVLLNLEKEVKRKLIAEMIDKINKNSFNKNDFDKLSADEKVEIKKIKIENQNDDRTLKKDLVDQVYRYPENRVIIVADISLSKNFLIYIEKIENVTISEGSEEYKKYFNESKIKIKNDLYSTYDSHLNKKYEIKINQKALDSVKNYFR